MKQNLAVENHPKTEYDKGFYKPDKSQTKDYLKDSGMISVKFNQQDDEEE